MHNRTSDLSNSLRLFTIFSSVSFFAPFSNLMRSSWFGWNWIQFGKIQHFSLIMHSGHNAVHVNFFSSIRIDVRQFSFLFCTQRENQTKTKIKKKLEILRLEQKTKKIHSCSSAHKKLDECITSVYSRLKAVLDCLSWKATTTTAETSKNCVFGLSVHIHTPDAVWP